MKLQPGRTLWQSCLLLCVLLLAPGGFAQEPYKERYGQVDRRIVSYSKAHGRSFDSLVVFVNGQFVADRDKIRAFYTWIALNISYDKDLLDNYKLNSGMALRRLSSMETQHPDTVLKYGKAVCEGFSLLMNKFCEDCSIISRMVVGPTRTEDGEVTDRVMHAWNAVKIDTAWHLLDVTWSNGYVNTMNQYVKKFSDRYFFTAPAEFGESHWPLDPMWQLSAFPVTKSIFYTGAGAANGTYFNYRDSIAGFLKLKPDSQEYVSFLHYHRADPSNETYTRECDRIVHDKLVNYLNLAAVYYDDYQLYARKYNGKVVSEKVVKECIRLLQQPRKYLVLALSYAQRKSFFHDEIRLNFEKMAAAAAKNLQEVDLAIEEHRKFARALKGSKK